VLEEGSQAQRGLQRPENFPNNLEILLSELWLRIYKRSVYNDLLEVFQQCVRRIRFAMLRFLWRGHQHYRGYDVFLARD